MGGQCRRRGYQCHHQERRKSTPVRVVTAGAETDERAPGEFVMAGSGANTYSEPITKYLIGRLSIPSGMTAHGGGSPCAEGFARIGGGRRPGANSLDSERRYLSDQIR